MAGMLKRVFGWGVIFLIGAVGAVVLADLYFNFRSGMLTGTNVRSVLGPDDEIGYDLKPNMSCCRMQMMGGNFFKTWTNELGCFDRPYEGEKEYILLMGDSYTWAWDSFENKFGTQLEAHLGMRVLKCGVPGFGTKQELIKARRILSRLPYPPRLIVVAYFVSNDARDDYVFPNNAVVDGILVEANDKEYNRPGGNRVPLEAMRAEARLSNSLIPPWGNQTLFKRWLAAHSPVFRALQDQDGLRSFVSRFGVCAPQAKHTPSDLFFTEEESPYLKDVWERHYENVRAFAELAREQKASIAFMVIPAMEEMYPFLCPEGFACEEPHAHITKFLAEEGIPYLDLKPLMRGFSDQTPRPRLHPEKDLCWPVDGHFNKNGDHLAGLLLAQYLMRERLVSVPQQDEKLRQVQEKLERLR